MATLFPNAYVDGIDIGSLLKGQVGDLHAHLRDLGLEEVPHHALKDAILQAKKFVEILNRM